MESKLRKYSLRFILVATALIGAILGLTQLPEYLSEMRIADAAKHGGRLVVITQEFEVFEVDEKNVKQIFTELIQNSKTHDYLSTRARAFTLIAFDCNDKPLCCIKYLSGSSMPKLGLWSKVPCASRSPMSSEQVAEIERKIKREYDRVIDEVGWKQVFQNVANTGLENSR